MMVTAIMISNKHKSTFLFVTVLLATRETLTSGFGTAPSPVALSRRSRSGTFRLSTLYSTPDAKSGSEGEKAVQQKLGEMEELTLLAQAKAADQISPTLDGKAATRTVNERLLSELQDASNKEKYGARSKMGKKIGLDSFRSQKTDEEREAALQEARNLNGVNPAVTLGGALFALAVAAALWSLTTFLAEFFALHPVVSDFYFVERVAAVFRNVVMGLVALASGFFGVTGFGIFLLGVRVAYGVMTGELDPTPIKNNKKQDKVEMPNVWDLMMNKKPTRRNKGNDNNSFGI